MEILELSPSLIKDVDTLLFDLDGTLVDMDPKFRLPLFFRGIKRFFPLLMPWDFIRYFWQAVDEIKKNESTLTNYEVFLNYFIQKNIEKAKLEKIFEEILSIDFPAMGKYFTLTPGADSLLKYIQKSNFKLILATNPMFPIKAVETRMKYAGVDPNLFKFITHSQNSTRCKPRESYYQELIEKLKLNPQKCLMVGNDPVKDLPASSLGIKTFLLKGPKFDQKIKYYQKHAFFYGSHLDLENLLKGIE